MAAKFLTTDVQNASFPVGWENLPEDLNYQRRNDARSYSIESMLQIQTIYFWIQLFWRPKPSNNKRETTQKF